TLRNVANPSNHLSEELKQHVRRMIGPIATPESIYFARLLPKTRSGKIMRRVIKAVAAGGPIGDLSTLEDGASVEEVRQAIEALQTAEKTT
ncbi:acetyl-CoA synthetase, partial [Candidatus Bathyarchaeota archaeon]